MDERTFRVENPMVIVYLNEDKVRFLIAANSRFDQLDQFARLIAELAQAVAQTFTAPVDEVWALVEEERKKASNLQQMTLEGQKVMVQ